MIPIDAGVVPAVTAKQYTVPGESLRMLTDILTLIETLWDPVVIVVVLIFGSDGVMSCVGCEVGVDEG
jgi:hypothetical protein